MKSQQYKYNNIIIYHFFLFVNFNIHKKNSEGIMAIINFHARSLLHTFTNTKRTYRCQSVCANLFIVVCILLSFLLKW